MIRLNRNIRNNPHRLYVIGGQEDGSVLSMVDNNLITQNGNPLGVLNFGERFNIDVSQGDIIEGQGSIIGAGEAGSSHYGWVPEYMKGKFLQTTIARGNPTRIEIYPLSSGTVDIFVNGNLMTTITLTQGVVSTYTDNTNGAWQLVSDVYILAQVRSGTGDPHTFAWGSDTKIGFSSGTGRVSTLIPDAPTNFLAYHYASNQTLSEDGVNQIGIGGSGTRSYESVNSASHIISTEGKRLFAHSYADADGGCSATWLPNSLMYHTVSLPHGTEFVSFINRNGSPIRKYDPTGALIGSLTMTRTNTSFLAPYAVRDGLVNNQINIPFGTTYSCDEKIYGVYQNRESTIYASLDDETCLMPTDIDLIL